MKIWHKIGAIGSVILLVFGFLYLHMVSPNAIDKRGTEIVLFMEVCFFGLCFLENRNDKLGKKSPLNEIAHIFVDYKFLLKQLVGRDFAVKYKRSYLGFLWTIINPLMTMIVMSAVFAYIFRIQTEYYSVYLIIGNVVFNYFSEATQLALSSVVGSGQLIKKVYMPKYIFPISKILFSFVNFLITLIPVAMVMLYYRIKVTSLILLLPIILACLFVFSLGIGLLMATLQVSLRDTQYLYGIVLTLWTYLTPLFYTMDSLSPSMQSVMVYNPMYIYIDSVRQVLIYHTLPGQWQMFGGMLYAIISLVIGLRVFYKHQNKFILHI